MTYNELKNQRDSLERQLENCSWKNKDLIDRWLKADNELVMRAYIENDIKSCETIYQKEVI